MVRGLAEIGGAWVGAGQDWIGSGGGEKASLGVGLGRGMGWSGSGGGGVGGVEMYGGLRRVREKVRGGAGRGRGEVGVRLGGERWPNQLHSICSLNILPLIVV